MMPNFEKRLFDTSKKQHDRTRKTTILEEYLEKLNPLRKYYAPTTTITTLVHRFHLPQKTMNRIIASRQTTSRPLTNCQRPRGGTGVPTVSSPVPNCQQPRSQLSATTPPTVSNHAPTVSNHAPNCQQPRPQMSAATLPNVSSSPTVSNHAPNCHRPHQGHSPTVTNCHNSKPTDHIKAAHQLSATTRGNRKCSYLPNDMLPNTISAKNQQKVSSDFSKKSARKAYFHRQVVSRRFRIYYLQIPWIFNPRSYGSGAAAAPLKRRTADTHHMPTFPTHTNCHQMTKLRDSNQNHFERWESRDLVFGFTKRAKGTRCFFAQRNDCKKGTSVDEDNTFVDSHSQKDRRTMGKIAHTNRHQMTKLRD